MRNAQASSTAKAVATMRVIASNDVAVVVSPGDEASVALLTQPLRGVVRVSAVLGGMSERLLRACFYVAGHLVDHVALRTCLIDRMVADSVAQGARQVVILGAGLDARAYRMKALGDVEVFEVDHPASQRYKIAHTQGLSPLCRSLSHVAMNFNQDNLVSKLLDHGYQPDVKSCFVCEGVFPYLRRDAVANTLNAVRDLCIDKSWFVATYLPATPHFPLHIRWLARPVLRLLGEPFGEDWSPEAFAQVATTAGFRAVADLAAPQWPAGLDIVGRGPLYDYERLVLLERDSNLVTIAAATTD